MCTVSDLWYIKRLGEKLQWKRNIFIYLSYKLENSDRSRTPWYRSEHNWVALCMSAFFFSLSSQVKAGHWLKSRPSQPRKPGVRRANFTSAKYYRQFYQRTEKLLRITSEIACKVGQCDYCTDERRLVRFGCRNVWCIINNHATCTINVSTRNLESEKK